MPCSELPHLISSDSDLSAGLKPNHSGYTPPAVAASKSKILGFDAASNFEYFNKYNKIFKK